MWWNFAHLFLNSLIPVATAWIATTRLAAGPVLGYAAVFVITDHKNPPTAPKTRLSLDCPHGSNRLKLGQLARSTRARKGVGHEERKVAELDQANRNDHARTFSSLRSSCIRANPRIKPVSVGCCRLQQFEATESSQNCWICSTAGLGHDFALRLDQPSNDLKNFRQR